MNAPSGARLSMREASAFAFECLAGVVDQYEFACASGVSPETLSWSHWETTEWSCLTRVAAGEGETPTPPGIIVSDPDLFARWLHHCEGLQERGEGDPSWNLAQLQLARRVWWGAVNVYIVRGAVFGRHFHRTAGSRAFTTAYGDVAYLDTIALDFTRLWAPSEFASLRAVWRSGGWAAAKDFLPREVVAAMLARAEDLVRGVRAALDSRVTLPAPR